MKRKILVAAAVTLGVLWIFGGCSLSEKDGAATPSAEESTAQTAATAQTTTETTDPTAENTTETTTERENMKINIHVNGSDFTAVLEDNDAAGAFAEILKTDDVTIEMRDYAGFEKVGSLDRSLPSNNRQTTTHSGDIVLYQGDQIVIFYGSNSWSYTRLGSVEDLSGWAEALGSGDVTVTFSASD